MSTAQQIETDRFYSREEYLLWCAAQPKGRFERVEGRIVAMAPERAVHVRVKGNVFLALRHAVAASGVDCQAWIDGLGVATGDSDYEPDAVVNCGQMSDDDMFATNPVVVVEVLSPSTAAVDTSGKLVGYFRVPSIVLPNLILGDNAIPEFLQGASKAEALASAVLPPSAARPAPASSSAPALSAPPPPTSWPAPGTRSRSSTGSPARGWKPASPMPGRCRRGIPRPGPGRACRSRRSSGC